MADNDLLTENTTLTKAQQTSVLERQLWAVADLLRGQMDSSEYSKYMLGIIFYKYLSENLTIKVLDYLDNEYETIEEAWENEPELADEIIESFGYLIKPQYLYHNIVKEIHKGVKGEWSVDYLHTAFNQLQQSPIEEDAKDVFTGLFDDIDLHSNKLGLTIPARNNKMAEVILEIAKIDFLLQNTTIDVLGDAYEYLIKYFAASAGKKGGEFYTPQQVSSLVSQILAYENPQMKTVYDPTCGSGSLLLKIIKNAQKDNNNIMVYGQELNSTTYNLARMNMVMHGQKWDQFSIKNNNTLTHDEFSDVKFSAIGANPPYSAKWKHTPELAKDPRFINSGRLAPQDKADFAFVQHSWNHLEEQGTAAIVLPHGILFRSGAEGEIRKWLIKENAIHAVIGLPEKLFYGTGIATVILVLKKGRKADEGILFIDSSKNFSKGKNQNYLEDTHLTTIMETYKNREDVVKYAHKADDKEIQKNDHNLNISRYVDTSDEEEIIDLDEVKQHIQETQSKIQELSAEIDNISSQLVEVDSIPIKKLDIEEETVTEKDETTLF